MASSSSLARITAATGPNVSSSKAAIPRSTLALLALPDEGVTAAEVFA